MHIQAKYRQDRMKTTGPIRFEKKVDGRTDRRADDGHRIISADNVSSGAKKAADLQTTYSIKRIIVNGNLRNFIQYSPKFLPQGPIDN